MNYKKHYRLLIEKALERVSCNEYTEKHHILPICLGGPNEAGNLVILTAREHFVAHWLLHRAYPEHDGLAFAFAMMTERGVSRNLYTPSSRVIAEARAAKKKASGVEIIQYDLAGNLIKRWDCAADAARKYTGNKSGSGIRHSAVWTRGCRTAYGYQWRYADERWFPPIENWEPAKPSEEGKAKMAEGREKWAKTARKEIHEYDNDGKYIQTFAGRRVAARHYGVQLLPARVFKSPLYTYRGNRYYHLKMSKLPKSLIIK